MQCRNIHPRLSAAEFLTSRLNHSRRRGDAALGHRSGPRGAAGGRLNVIECKGPIGIPTKPQPLKSRAWRADARTSLT